MTPNELRKLADEATPGPWEIIESESPDNQWRLFANGGRGTVPATLADDRLVALAPDLARLCAEQHEALSWALSSLDTVLARRPHKAIPEMRACGEAALAKLSELEIA